MIIKSADYLQSAIRADKLPNPTLPEYAFIGRSNVGKSSLINMLTQRKALAKTSATPGKTITINHFIINKDWFLVDLPGYGFAKRSKKDRDIWQKMLNDYIGTRENLMVTFVLVDVRIDPQTIDINFINWLGENGIPFAVIFTKADKVSKGKASHNVELFKRTLAENWDELPPMFLSSSEDGLGRDEILNYIEETNKLFEKH